MSVVSVRNIVYARSATHKISRDAISSNMSLSMIPVALNSIRLFKQHDVQHNACHLD